MDFEQYKLLTESQVVVLKEIAALCPHSDGPAVYTARALLRGTDTFRKEYMNECEKVFPASSSNRQSQNTIQDAFKKNSLDFSVLPNPASSTIILNHYGNYKTMLLEEISGKIIFEMILNENKTSELINVSNLSNGIYIIKMQGDATVKQ